MSITSSDNIITSSSKLNVEEIPEERGVAARFKRLRHKEFIIAGVVILFMLIIYFATRSSFAGGASGAPPNNVPDEIEGECRLRRVERQLTDAINGISGVSNAQVIINWESTMEQVIAYITQNSQNSSSQTPGTIQIGPGQFRPIVIREIYPRVIGVLVVADGAHDARIRIDITNAVITLFSIRPAQVSVLPR